MKRRVAIAVALSGLLLASHAVAAPTNSEIGLTALGEGQYTVAVQAFTKALKSDNLIDGLKVFAYTSRAKAHIGLHQIKLAKADFQSALAIDPTDEQAQQGLAALGSAGVAASNSLPTKNKIEIKPKNLWGPLATLVGHPWIESGGSTGRWYEYTWEKPGEILAFHGMDQAGNAIAGHYQLDAASDHITGLTVYKGQSIQTDLSEVTDGSMVEAGQQQGVQVRVSLVYQRAGVFEQSTTALVSGAWKPLTTVKLVQASPDVIATLGWKQAPQESGFVKFMKGIGGALADGAKAGLQDGVHDGVQAKAQHAIAPKQYPTTPQ